MRLSAYLLGVFSPSLPQQRPRLQALCAPWSPDTPPLSGTSGERDPGSRLGHSFRGRAWQSLTQVRRGILVKQVGEQLCENITWTPRVSCRLSKTIFTGDLRLPRRSLTVTWWWIVPTCLLLPCYQVDVLFYSGEEVWAASGKPAPNSREEEGCGLAWEWKGERETIQSTIPFPHCLPA